MEGPNKGHSHGSETLIAEGDKAIITAKLCELVLHTVRYWIMISDYQADCGGLSTTWGWLATALAKLLKSESPIALVLPNNAD